MQRDTQPQDHGGTLCPEPSLGSQDIEYMIAHSPTLEGLEKTIPTYVREGWHLQGGISAVPRQLSEDEASPGFGPVYSFMQALVKPIAQDFYWATEGSHKRAD